MMSHFITQTCWHENWIGEMLMLIENVGSGEYGNGQGFDVGFGLARPPLSKR